MFRVKTRKNDFLIFVKIVCINRIVTKIRDYLVKQNQTNAVYNNARLSQK